jgi:F-type H+-transporting ATPase subunit b
VSFSPHITLLTVSAPGSFWHTLVQTNLFNFILAAFILGYLAYRMNVVKMLDDKRLSIMAEMNEAEARREKAESDIQGLENRRLQLENDLNKMIIDAETSAKQLAETMIQQAQEDSVKLRAQALKRIEQEQLSLKRELEARLVQDAIVATKALLENTLTDADKLSTVEAFMENLPQVLETQEASR